MRTLALLFLISCTSSPPPKASDPPAKRTPAVATDSPHYDLFEGTSYKNDCAQDADCHIGGCGHEVCSAETQVMTPCMALADAPRDSCGCVANVCIWYR